MCKILRTPLQFREFYGILFLITIYLRMELIYGNQPVPLH